MKIFVFEYVTGGGFAGEPLPEFVGDGETMWRALVEDLTALDGVDVITLRDDRLDWPRLPGLRVMATDAARFQEDFRRCLDAADAVWPVAPESGGLLENLSRDILAAGKRLLGSRPDAVRIAASKRATSRRLLASGARVARVYTSPFLMTDDRPVVAKPDDGAGCVDTLFFSGPAEARSWAMHHGGDAFVYQYHHPGRPLSLSMLCCEGRAQLLSVNSQHVELAGGRFLAHGVTVNTVADPDGIYEWVARCVAEALPDLWGYVGVDLIAAADGPRILEINPRLTLSYAGLGAAVGGNTAGRVLALPAFAPRADLRAVAVGAREPAPAAREAA